MYARENEVKRNKETFLQFRLEDQGEKWAIREHEKRSLGQYIITIFIIIIWVHYFIRGLRASRAEDNPPQ